MQILFVDDIADTRIFFQLALGASGHVVHPVGSGTQALQAIQQRAYDAIVLDVEMSELNGWETLKRIRELPQGQDIPVVMFTAYYHKGMDEMAQVSGADWIAGKPLLPAQLLKVIEQLVEKRHPLQNESADQRDLA